MPRYVLKCKKCREHWDEMAAKPPDLEDVNCPHCGVQGVLRDYRGENAISTFHPTVDIYKTKKRKVHNEDCIG